MKNLSLLILLLICFLPEAHADFLNGYGFIDILNNPEVLDLSNLNRHQKPGCEYANSDDVKSHKIWKNINPKMDQFCNDPEKFLCSPEYNPYIEKYIQKNLENRNTDDQMSYLNKYTKKVEAIFDKTKTLFKKTLEKKVTKTNQVELKRLILAIDSMELHIDFNSTDYGAAYYARQNQVGLYGMANLSEDAPEIIEMILLHELSHSVGPVAFAQYLEKDFWYNYSPYKMIYNSPVPAFENKYPFLEELKCLSRKDTANSRVVDVKCHEKLVKENDALKYPTSLLVHSVQAKVGRINQYLGIGLPNPDNLPDSCKSAQSDEVFADWLMTESMTEQLLPATNLANINKNLRLVQAMSTFRCVQKVRKMSDDLITSEGHPSPRTQVNGIIMANPKIYESVGCNAGKIQRIEKDTKVSIPKTIGSYCGSSLHD